MKDPEHAKSLPKPARGQIDFDNVSFNYPARPDIPALQNVTLSIHPGETVAFVGPSGAGKTTIIQMLQRFYDPLAGEIRIDDVALTEMDRTEFRSELALVPQDPVIFATTARENIRFGASRCNGCRC